MTVPPVLIRRLKSHFVALPCGVDLILGLNGYIWVSKHVKESEQEGEDGFDAEAVYSNKNDVSPPWSILSLTLEPSRSTGIWQPIDDATRAAIARVSNIIRALAAHFVPLTDAVLLEAYEWAVEQESGIKDILHDDHVEHMVASIGAGMRQ